MPRIHGIPVSPRARRLMAKRQISIDGLHGSGPNGRIVQADLARHSAVSPLRLAVARATAESCLVPQFHLRAEIEASALLAFRANHIDSVQQSHRVRISLTDLFLRAVGCALAKHPRANSVWRGDSIEPIREANVGLVVSVPDGLVIPVLRRVDALDLATLALKRAELGAIARSSRLAAEQTRAAAASVSNLGRSRIDEFTALLAPGQTTMLAIGRVAERPFCHKGQISTRPTVRLTLTVDHRVLDGEPAAAFLASVIEGLENPASLFSGSPAPR